MWSSPLLLFCVLLWPLTAAEQPEELLLRVRAKCINTLNRLPRYMCTQTIDRDYFEPARHSEYKSCDDLLGAKRRKPVPLRRVLSDRLRLNVATTSAGEMYSWVGDTTFHDNGVFDLLEGGPSGPMQTGSFASFLTMIFGNDEAVFSYLGENVVNERRVVEFRFRTPSDRSHYSLGRPGHGTRVAYEGTLTADASTLDLVQMIVRTTSIPDQLATCEVTTTLDYHRVRLRNEEFLLPAQTQLHMIMSNGEENNSRTGFSACHEFLGESTLKFDAPDAASAKPESIAELRTLVLPPKQLFSVVLTEGIDTDTAAAGDAIQGKLTSSIKGKRPKLEIAAGTPVHGRIVKLQRSYATAGELTLVIRLETLVVNGVLVPFTAKADAGSRTSGRNPGFLQSRGIELGRIGDLYPRGEKVFLFKGTGDHYLIKTGLESRWVTL